MPCIMLKTQLLEELRKLITENKVQKFEEIIHKRTRHVTVVLENLYQPHNASAVMRSCDCFGIQDLHVIENNNNFKPCEDISLGSSQWIDLHRYKKEKNNTVACLNQLKKKGYKIIATTPHTNDVTINELDLSEKTALLFGTELTGLSDLALEHADGFVKIPMQGFTESFNISVSAALCMYDVTTRLRNSNINWQLTDEEKIDIEINWCKQVIKHADKVEQEILRRLKA